MKIFVIYSFADSDNVQKCVNELNEKTISTEILMLKNEKTIWKRNSKRKIKSAQLVLVFLGENTHKSKNVEWEINKAFKYGKRVVSVHLKPENKTHPALTNTRVTPDYQDMKFSELIDYVQSNTNGDYSLFNDLEDSETNQKYLFEQYKAFLQTSESLVERRQKVNSFYITVNTSIFTIATAFLALAEELSWKCFTSFALSIFGIILCYSWVRILRSYGNLNASKMRIISILEKNFRQTCTMQSGEPFRIN